MNDDAFREEIKNSLDSALDRNYTLETLGIDSDDFSKEAKEILMDKIKEKCAEKVYEK